jgi:hypothetical protein
VLEVRDRLVLAPGVERVEAGVDQRDEAAGIATEARPRRAHRLLPEQRAQPPREHLPDAVARHVGEEHEELVNGGVAVLAIAPGVRRDVAQAADRDQIGGSAALDGEPAHLERDGAHHLGHLADERQVHAPAVEKHRSEELERRVDERLHGRAVALAHAHDAEPLEDLDGLAHRRAIHAELGRELALRRQLRAGREAAVEDRVAELLGDVLVEAPAGGSPEGHDGHASGYRMVQPICQLLSSPM